MEIYEQIIYHYTERELKEYLERHYFDAIGIGGCGGYYQYRKIKQIAEAVSNVKTEMFRREGIKPFFWMGDICLLRILNIFCVILREWTLL